MEVVDWIRKRSNTCKSHISNFIFDLKIENASLSLQQNRELICEQVRLVDSLNCLRVFAWGSSTVWEMKSLSTPCKKDIHSYTCRTVCSLIISAALIDVALVNRSMSLMLEGDKIHIYIYLFWPSPYKILLGCIFCAVRNESLKGIWL